MPRLGPVGSGRSGTGCEKVAWGDAQAVAAAAAERAFDPKGLGGRARQDSLDVAGPEAGDADGVRAVDQVLGQRSDRH